MQIFVVRVTRQTGAQAADDMPDSQDKKNDDDNLPDKLGFRPEHRFKNRDKTRRKKKRDGREDHLLKRVRFASLVGDHAVDDLVIPPLVSHSPPAPCVRVVRRKHRIAVRNIIFCLENLLVVIGALFRISQNFIRLRDVRKIERAVF